LPNRLILNSIDSGVLVAMRLGVMMLFVMITRGMTDRLLAAVMFAPNGGIGRANEGHNQCGDCK
jgi:hypothetical protein